MEIFSCQCVILFLILGIFGELAGLKEKQPLLKLIFNVGADVDVFSSMSSSVDTRTVFINSTVNIIK